jgi:murein DD-endopeptidase MepM/ murein hydrolase activator NlpD
MRTIRAIFLFALCISSVAAAELAVTIEVNARAVAPGEPVRVEVLSPAPLQRLEGRFLDEAVFMSRIEAAAEGEKWSGWAMIPLDQAPGQAAVEMSGIAECGRPVVGTLAVTVAAKEFPEEHLSVAPKYVEPPAEAQQRLSRERARLRALYKERRPLSSAGAVFVRPVPGEPTSIFGTRRLFNNEPRSPHPGLDLRAQTGTPVKAAGPGVVVLAQDLYYSGNTVLIDHGGGLFTIYAHLSEIAAEEGLEVEAGRQIGLSGATGRVTGPPLHWGAKIGNRPFDPTALLDPALFAD